MHEHATVMTMNGAYCPTCGKFLKDIPKAKETKKPQKEWIETLRKFGYAAYVCKGFKTAQERIIAYLEGRAYDET